MLCPPLAPPRPEAPPWKCDSEVLLLGSWQDHRVFTVPTPPRPSSTCNFEETYPLPFFLSFKSLDIRSYIFPKTPHEKPGLLRTLSVLFPSQPWNSVETSKRPRSGWWCAAIMGLDLGCASGFLQASVGLGPPILISVPEGSQRWCLWLPHVGDPVEPCAPSMSGLELWSIVPTMYLAHCSR